MELSVVVPVLNESASIGPLIAEIRAAVDGRRRYEIIVVDDGSTDDTARVLHEAKRDCPELRVLRHDRTSGQSRAIVTAVRAARGTWIATLDGDGQNDPADIPRLMARVADAADADSVLIVGHRQSRRDGWIKRFSSRVANGVRGRLLGDRTPDTGCGLKLLRRQLFLDLPYFDHMHRFLPALVLRAGGRVESVAVHHRPRLHGRSKYGTLDRLLAGVVDLAGMLWLLRRSRRPGVTES